MPGGSIGTRPPARAKSGGCPSGAGTVTSAGPDCSWSDHHATHCPGGRCTERLVTPGSTTGATSRSGPSRYSSSACAKPAVSDGNTSGSGRIEACPCSCAPRISIALYGTSFLVQARHRQVLGARGVADRPRQPVVSVLVHLHDDRQRGVLHPAQLGLGRGGAAVARGVGAEGGEAADRQRLRVDHGRGQSPDGAAAAGHGVAAALKLAVEIPGPDDVGLSGPAVGRRAHDERAVARERLVEPRVVSGVLLDGIHAGRARGRAVGELDGVARVEQVRDELLAVVALEAPDARRGGPRDQVLPEVARPWLV